MRRDFVHKKAKALKRVCAVAIVFVALFFFISSAKIIMKNKWPHVRLGTSPNPNSNGKSFYFVISDFRFHNVCMCAAII